MGLNIKTWLSLQLILKSSFSSISFGIRANPPVPENIIGEQGVSTKEVRGNFARQAKSDLPDPELLKQGAFVGTLKEYILMKLKEVE